MRIELLTSSAALVAVNCFALKLAIRLASLVLLFPSPFFFAHKIWIWVMRVSWYLTEIPHIPPWALVLSCSWRCSCLFWKRGVGSLRSRIRTNEVEYMVNRFFVLGFNQSPSPLNRNHTTPPRESAKNLCPARLIVIETWICSMDVVEHHNLTGRYFVPPINGPNFRLRKK